MKTSIPSPKSAPSVADIKGGKTIPMPGSEPTIDGGIEPVPTEPVLTPPFEISGLYAVESVLSRGGMGTTYLGYSLRDQKQEVVIKVPDTHSASTLRRFEKECLTLEQLDHENIVKCLGYSTFSHGGESYPYLAMVYVKGQTLRQRLGGGRMPWEEVKILLENMLRALGYIASQGICHRDIKPENIIYDADSQKWVLVDFGIAKTSKAQVWKTLEANDGTWDYMSPEQKSGEQVDIRSDIYSLGKVAWEALLGARPEVGSKYPFEAGVEGCTADVDTLISKMVEFSPKDRYATPEEALNALRRGAESVERKRRRRRILLRALCVGCWCLGVLSLFAAVWVTGDFVCTAKLKQVAESSKSPTVQLREMNAAVVGYPMRWGRRYLSSEDVATIKVKADRELKRMQDELQKLRELLLVEMRDEDKAYRFKNFLAKWEKAFSGTNDYQEAVGYLAELYSVDEVNDVQKMRESLASVKSYEHSNRFIADAGAKRSAYKSKAAREQMDELLQEAVQKRIKLACHDVDAAIERGNLDELYAVYAKCRERMRELNAPTELSESEKQLIISINKLFHDKINEALGKTAYTSAKELLNRHAAAKIPGVDDDVAKVKKLINDGQLVFDWNQVIERGNEALANKNFKYAMDVLDKFQEKHPNQTRFDLKQNRTIIAERYANYIITQKENYEIYYEEAGKFMEMFSGADYADSRTKVQRFMCWSIHNRITDVICNKNNTMAVKLAALQGISLRYVSPEHGDYLRAFLSEAQRYAQNNTDEARRSFWYCMEQVPAECVKVTKKDFAKIKIESIEVRMSRSRYEDIRGLNHCNPYVVVRRENKNDKKDTVDIWKGLGAVDQLSFTVYPDVSFILDIDSEQISIKEGDDDGIGFKKEDGFLYSINFVKEAGTCDYTTFTTDDGTEFIVRYTFE
ncbi:MAG: serine/threonine-protein kinase [Bacteroidales bacterium]|nr:serine/threonine-protein kinase [Bacteroidales bacterium]